MLQPFAEVGVRFLVKSPAGPYLFSPDRYLPVRAYLLDAAVRPRGQVPLGLEPLTTHGSLHAGGKGSYFELVG